ncbi:MAG: hypothetical protein P4L74_04500 [Candidatus Doudnabacteria bacterium]|nr:hypothetical protein [Candidatus Doudnabacteria bacterium]
MNKPLITKVPEITAYFWIIKVLTTGMGETTSDYLVRQINPVIAVALGFIGLVIALMLQFSARRYVTWIYWLAVIMVAVFGTMAADVLHIVLGIPYLVSAIFFTIVLVIIFAVWYKSENTLSIHSINTTRREVFYWATVLTTFALGTAVGDMTATTMHLGYFSSGVLFLFLIAVVTAAHYIAKAILGAEHRRMSSNAVLAFWLAYILTRPLGASFADWIGVPASRSGLGWGTGPVSLVLLVIIICFVGYLTVSRKDVKS